MRGSLPPIPTSQATLNCSLEFRSGRRKRSKSKQRAQSFVFSLKPTEFYYGRETERKHRPKAAKTKEVIFYWPTITTVRFFLRRSPQLPLSTGNFMKFQLFPATFVCECIGERMFVKSAGRTFDRFERSYRFVSFSY